MCVWRVKVSYYGTNSNDILNIEGQSLLNELIHGRGGYDILALSSSADFTFNRDSYWKMRKIEEIDFSGINGG